MTAEPEYGRYRPLSLLLAGVALVYVATGSVSIFRTPVLGVMFCPGYEVCRIYPGSAAQAAGFHLGDKIRAVDGKPIDQVGPLGADTAQPGDRRVYAIDRAGDLREIAVRLGSPSVRSIYLRLGPTLIGVIFILVGWVVFLRRPDRPSGVFFVFCLATGWILSGPPHLPGPYSRFVSSLLEIMALFTCAGSMFHLFSVFPRRKRWIRDHPKLVRWLWVVSAAAVLTLIFELMLSLLLGVTFPRRVLVVLNYAAGSFIIGYLLLATFSFFHSYFTISSPLVRRCLRLILLGLVFGVAPVAVYSILFAVNPHRRLPLEEHVVLLASLIPLSLGYSLLRLQGNEPPSETG